MRRCAQCRELGARLTAPAELLGGLVLLPMPPGLAKLDWSRVLGSVGRNAARSAARRAAQTGQHATISLPQLAIVVLVTIAVTLPVAGATAAPGTPGALVQAGAPRALLSSPARPAAGHPAASVAPRPPASLIAVVEPYLGLASSSGFSSQPVTVRLFNPDGQEANSLTLKAGIRLLAVAGSRLYVLEPGGVVRGVRGDGSVEDLGTNPVADEAIASPDGTRWMWTTSSYSRGVAGRWHSAVYLGGIGLQPQLIEELTDPLYVLRPLWTRRGPVITRRPTGIGSMSFDKFFLGPAQLVDPDRGSLTPLPGADTLPFHQRRGCGRHPGLAGAMTG